MMAHHYYSILSILLAVFIQDKRMRVMSTILGLHMFVAPYLRKLLGMEDQDFFLFYALWDSAFIPFIFISKNFYNRVALCLCYGLSVFVQMYSYILWDVLEHVQYTYYQVTNKALGEMILVVLLFNIKNKIMNVIAGCLIALYWLISHGYL